MEQNIAIKLNKDNIDKINYDEIIAVTIAEGGAMSEPNAFYAVLNNLERYYVNLGDSDITKEQFFKSFPVMEKFNCLWEEVLYLDKGWSWFNMGCGNYLLVREKYKDKIYNYIKGNFGDDWHHGELYQKWYEALKNIINTK